jgi:hypothetical protein|tara:strand:+ start:5596 stop:8880 length:3285 start_codon:yes stop_codon:yes gene_type:complete
MAYNSDKGPQHTGDLQYEGDPNDVQIDFENDQIILRTGGAPRVSVVNTQMSASGIFRNVGSISGSGDIAVSGAIHAANFYGDGSGLTSIAATTVTIANDADTRLITAGGDGTLTGEALLTFDGSNSILTITNGTLKSVNVSGSGTVTSALGITSSTDIVASGTMHATTFYGSAAGLTGIPAATFLSGTTAQLTTGVETSGYLKVTGSSTLADVTTTSLSSSGFNADSVTAASAQITINFNVGTSGQFAPIGNAYIYNIGYYSGSGGFHNVSSMSSSGDLAVTGAVHAATFYGDGSNLTGISAGSVSGSARVYSSTGVETSGYLKVTGSSTLGAVTATTISASSTLQVVGGTILGNSLNVSGTTVMEALTANGITNASTYSGSNTLVTVGSISSSADVAVTGAIHAANFYGDGSNLTGISAGNVSGSARVYTVTGLETSGYLKVSGSATLGPVTITGTGSVSDIVASGSISGSSTLQAVGATTLGSTLAVSGTVTVAGDIDHAGDPDTYLRFQTNTVNLVAGGKSAIKLETSTGKIQLNNSNEDLDVQIMADNGAVILHADGATNKIGINTDVPAEALSVVGNISGSGTTRLVGSISGSGDIAVSGAIHAANFYGDGSGLTNVTAGAPTSLSGTTAQLTTGVETSGYLKVTGSSTLAGVTATTISASSTLQVVGNAVLGGNTNVSGNIALQATEPTIYFSSSAGTALGQMGYNSSDNILIQNNTVNKHIVFKVNDAATIREGFRIDGAVPEVVVNQGSDSLVDFRVESDNNTHMLFVDGGTDKVGINTDTPSEVLTIVGNISGSGTTRLVGSISGSGDIAVSGAIHAANFYGDGSGLTNVTAGAPTSLSGTTAQLTTGVETSGYLKVTGSSTLAGPTAVSAPLTLTAPLSSSATVHVVGATSMEGALTLSSSVTAVGLFSADIISGSGGMHVDSATSFGGTLNVTGTVGIGTPTALTALDVHHNPTTLGNDAGGGDVVQFGTGTTTAGKLYYLHSGSSWEQTDLSTAASGGLGMLGIALGTSPASHGVLLRGFFDMHSYLSGAFTAGTTLYIAAPGYITSMRPSGSTEIVRVLGTCTTTANVIYFNPSPDYLVIT